ncbi:DUF2111 domain-containing protein [Methanothermobacter sp. KEPCO-1]|uniref:DUF2111 domain-containing protein n=1 Tax=Methanothermobacter TaxID=145260 RepID=UPI0011CA33A4|nr:DUF2111 domain-containing protein [Methanothermobacter sp. KEPCO-1]QEF94100.1 DUF2111 domain-containing protein [Methanothermobacter sp. KEPCO-1]
MKITSSSTGEELKELGMCIHELVSRLPLTIRSREAKGLRIEDGRVIDDSYTGPVLEKVLESGEIARETPERGPYKGIPVVVVPLKEKGEVLCAVGIVDATKGLFTDMVEIARRPQEGDRGEFY